MTVSDLIRALKMAPPDRIVTLAMREADRDLVRDDTAQTVYKLQQALDRNGVVKLYFDIRGGFSL